MKNATARPRTAVLYSVFIIALISAAPAASQNFCTLQTSADFSGYKMRDNRCEGIYAQDVSANLIQVISFVHYFADFSGADPAQLVIRWRDDSNSDLWLSGRGRARNSFYGFDTRVPAATGQFTWSPKILLDKGYGKRQLGFLAWRDSAADDPESRVHVPIVISHDKQPPAAQSLRAGSYELVVRPGEAFREFYLELERKCRDGYVVVTAQYPLGRDFYSARRLQHRIDVDGPPGVYRLILSAQRADGSYTSPRQFLFYHDAGGVNAADAGAECE